MGELVLSVKSLEVKADELGKAFQVALDHILGFRKLLEEREKALSTTIEENYKILSESLDKQKTLSENNIKVSHNSIDEKITVLEAALNEEKGNLIEIIDRSRQEIVDQLSIVENDIKEGRTATDGKLTIYRDEFVGYISKLEKELDEQATSFEKDLITNRTELTGQLGDIEKTLGKLKEATDKSIKSSQIEFSQGLKELNKTILDVSKKSNEVVSELRSGEDEVRLELDSIKGNVFELSEVSKVLQADSSKQIRGIETKLKSLGEASQDTKKEIQIVQKKLEEINKAMADRLIAQEAALKKVQNEIVTELQDREKSINGSLIGVKKNETLIKKTNEELENLNSKIKFTLKDLEKNKIKLEDLEGVYKRDIQTEKVRISKALALGRASFSGFQMFFKGKYAEDKVHDAETIKRLKKYNESVNKFGFLNGLVYQRFNRNLDRDKINSLIQEWQSTLDIKISEDKLAYMAHKIWLIEGTCSGRLATNVEDEIIRCLIAAYVGQEGLRGMEIGALFGVNICCLKELASPYCKSFHLTVVDPLEGYYAKQPHDILVDEPINEEIFWKNIGRYCKKSEVRLIKKYTYDMDARNFGKRTFNYVLIDGDHTYDGVKVDFELIKDFVEPGGYILFDDYNTKHWPDVKTYVDEAVLTDDNYKEVISMHRTCVVQKLK